MLFFQGMEYLHKSPITKHGRLRSSNCLVDSRWSVKIADWGIIASQQESFEMENEMLTGKPSFCYNDGLFSLLFDVHLMMSLVILCQR